MSRRQEAVDHAARKDSRPLFFVRLWSVLSVSIICLNRTIQMNQKDQPDQRDQMNQRDERDSRSARRDLQPKPGRHRGEIEGEAT